MEDKDFNHFIKNVKKRTGIDLAKYKEEQMKRRLSSLYLKHGYRNFEQLYNRMEKDPNLLRDFLDQMTINVTEFYRNPLRWDVLRKEILPGLVMENRTIKCWSAACSTGEEPFTLAMIFHEMKIKNAEIIATDIDEKVLTKANEGVYGERALQELPEDYRRKYFNKRESAYVITDLMKGPVNFKRLNLLMDPFDRDFDLIICRNVMIYFTEEANHELTHKLSDALRPGGILFVGSTEQIFQPEKYNLKMEENFFYRKL